jgi:hypothetical protein
VTRFFALFLLLFVGQSANAERCYEVSTDGRTWGGTMQNQFCTDRDDLRSTSPQTFTLKNEESGESTMTLQNYHLTRSGLCPQVTTRTNNFIFQYEPEASRAVTSPASPTNPVQTSKLSLTLNFCSYELPPGATFAIEIGPLAGSKTVLFARETQ